MSYYKNGKKKYEGEWKDDKPNGKGVYYYENGNKLYEGEWQDGEYDGKGVQYDEDGNIAPVEDEAELEMIQEVIDGFDGIEDESF